MKPVSFQEATNKACRMIEEFARSQNLMMRGTIVVADNNNNIFVSSINNEIKGPSSFKYLPPISF